MCLCVWTCPHYGAHVKVGGQFWGVNSLFVSSLWVPGFKLRLQQAPLPFAPPHRPSASMYCFVASARVLHVINCKVCVKTVWHAVL